MPTASETEWYDQLNHSAMTYGLASRGLAIASKEFSSTVYQISPLPKNRTFLAMRKPGESQVTVYAQWRSLELPELMRANGPIIHELGRQWVVTIYSLWETSYRKRFAPDAGLLDEHELVVPVMGDLKRLRNDIVHHGGIASKNNSGKCSLLSHWVTIGHPIELTELMILEFMEFWGQTVIGPVLGDDINPKFGLNVVENDGFE